MLLASTINGRLLPPQVIYTGTTERCHPHYSFPEDWNITQTPSHWSNTESMHEYLQEVIIPYVQSIRAKKGFDEDHKAILILDTYRAHTEECFLPAMADAHIHYIYVPPGSTADLQPLDVEGSVNMAIKRRITNEYNTYQDDLVLKAMESNGGRWTSKVL